MFSLSQYIIIGLAGLIYVAGTVFLLMGRSFLQNSGLPPVDASEEWAAKSEAVEGSPYFFPVLEEGTLERVGSTGPFSSTGKKQARTTYSDPSLDRQTTGHRSEKIELVLLTDPICLN